MTTYRKYAQLVRRVNISDAADLIKTRVGVHNINDHLSKKVELEPPLRWGAWIGRGRIAYSAYERTQTKYA